MSGSLCIAPISFAAIPATARAAADPYIFFMRLVCAFAAAHISVIRVFGQAPRCANGYVLTARAE